MRLGVLLLLGLGCRSDGKLSVNNAGPDAIITSHEEAEPVREGASELFSGSVSDATDAASTLSVTWFAGDEIACVAEPPRADGRTDCTITVPEDDDLTVRLEVRDPSNALGEDTVTVSVTPTNAPVVTLSEPTADDPYIAGELIGFVGTVTDAEDAPESLEVWFESSLEGRIEIDATPTSTGDIAGSISLSEGSHDLALWAQDSDGKTDSARVIIDVVVADDLPPSVLIVLPDVDAGGVYYSGQLIEMSGEASDTEDDPTELIASWRSSIDGVLEVDATVESDGSVTSFSELLEGVHVLTLTVADTVGQTASDSVILTVGPPNSAPSCEITQPEDDSVAVAGDTVVFEATAADLDVPSDWLEATWFSDKDGELGSGIPTTPGDLIFATDALSVDTHTITLTVTDELGLTCTDAIMLAISTPPSISITAPADGATVNQGDAITFAATVSDEEDGAAALVVAWLSSLDGLLASGAPDSAGTSTFISDALSGGTHVLTVTVTDSDGLYATAVRSLNVNRAPSAPEVTISPEFPQTGDPLIATLLTPGIDPDGELVSYTHAWLLGGLDTGESGVVLPSSATTKGDVWTLVLTPSDGAFAGTPGTASTTIGNTPPVLDAVSLSPGEPAVTDTIHCLPGTATDADGEAVSFSYAWTVNGLDAGVDTSTLDAGFALGDRVRCTVTPTDGEDEGLPVSSPEVEIDNSLPFIASVSISPDPAVTGDSLLCTWAGFTDADGDADISTLVWQIGGLDVGSAPALASGFVGGDTVRCTVTPHDGIEAGTPVWDSLVVQNTVPVMGPVVITPDPATNSDTLSCAATATDVDGDSPTLSYTWSTGATGSTLTLSSAVASPGDAISCTATATDAAGGTASESSSITLSNRSPSVTVSLSPADPVAGDTVVCSAVATDPDGDATTLTYVWSVDGLPSTESSSSYAAAISRDQLIQCTVTATDGSGDTGTDSASVTIANTAPEVLSVSLIPATLYTNDTATALATTTDADADPLALVYAFTVNGTIVQEGPDSSLDGAIYFDKGQAVAVTVTASDGLAESSLASASVEVSNSPPTAPVADIVPAGDPDMEGGHGVDESEGLLCDVDAVSIDADGDAISYRFDWLLDGVSFTDVETTVFSGDTISVDDTAHGDEWTCTLTPSDPDVDGPSDSVTKDVYDYVNTLDMASGGYHNCAIRSSGQLTCWGSNGDGRSRPPSGTFTDVAAGEYGACGIRSGGSLQCWGRNHHSMLSPPSGNFSQVNSAYWHSCAVRTSGAARCWGYNAYGQSSAPSGAFTQVALGAYHTCGVRTSGALACWGRNNHGQRSAPSGSYLVVAAEHFHNCAIRTSGAVRCWGMNGDGQSSPPSGTFTDISAGAFHSCGIRTDGTLRCWGRNDNGQSSPPSGTYFRVEAGSYHSCAISTSGSVECWGRNSSGQSNPPRAVSWP